MRAGRRFFRPVWAEVDLDALRSNLRLFRSRMPRGTKLLFVVKANAYGHGAAACARAAQRSRLADGLGVSSVEEGIALREAGLRLPILVLGSLYPFESFLAAAEYRLTPTVASLESARRLSEAALRLGRRVGCHLKIETGMGRIGMSPAAALGVAEFLSGRKEIRVEGIYTHFSSADSDPAFTRRQNRIFRGVLESFAMIQRRCQGSPRYGDQGDPWHRRDWPVLRHAANSAAALRYPETRWDMVRPGLALYGLTPGFRPVLSLKTKVVFLKTVVKGTPISYGAAYRARRRTRIATIPVGYADGYARSLSGRAEALLNGRRCPVVGKVTMDMSMLDVTRAPAARVGDDVVLLGSQGRERIAAPEIARWAGTIPYEVTCAVSTRVPRVYLT